MTDTPDPLEAAADALVAYCCRGKGGKSTKPLIRCSPEVLRSEALRHLKAAYEDGRASTTTKEKNDA